jgi:hypothetical protein
LFAAASASEQLCPQYICITPYVILIGRFEVPPPLLEYYIQPKLILKEFLISLERST